MLNHLRYRERQPHPIRRLLWECVMIDRIMKNSGKKKGETVITVTLKSGKTATCKVVVN